MRLQRFGSLLLVISICALVLRPFGMHPRQVALGVLLAGFGVALIVLGGVIRIISGVMKAPFSAQPVPQWGQCGRTVRLEKSGWAPSVSAMGPTPCSNCQEPLPAGAKFCRRCGSAVSGRPVPVVKPPVLAPPIAIRTPVRPPVAVRPRSGAPVIRALLFLAAMIVAMGVLSNWHETGRLPWNHWAQDLEHWIGARGPKLAMPLPVAADPQLPGRPAACYINPPLVETAVDENGYVGLRISASVYAANMTGLRLGIHIFNSDFTRVASSDPRYRDARGQTATAVPVPPPVQWDVRMPDRDKVAAFIPIAALDLPNEPAYLKILVSLYDSSNQPIGPRQVVSFAVYHKQAEITRVELSGESFDAARQSVGRNLTVSLRVPGFPQYDMHGDVVVRFKDENGRAVLATPFGGFSQELRLTSRFNIRGVGTGLYPEHADRIFIPINAAPPRATAEIVLEQAGEQVSQVVTLKMP